MPSDNHLVKSDTKVTITFPEEVEIEFVQANEVKNYELFLWLVAIALQIATGFWTSYVTDTQNKSFLWSASVFTSVTILFIWLSYKSRSQIFKNTVRKSLNLKEFEHWPPTPVKDKTSIERMLGRSLISNRGETNQGAARPPRMTTSVPEDSGGL